MCNEVKCRNLSGHTTSGFKVAFSRELSKNVNKLIFKSSGIESQQSSGRINEAQIGDVRGQRAHLMSI